MRAIIKKDRAPGVEYVNIPKPEPKEDEVLIKVKAAAICGLQLLEVERRGREVQ